MATVLIPDICVIGGGTGGQAVARGAAALGASVVLLERGTFGGRRLIEDVPAGALRAAARQAWLMRRGAAFGIAADEVAVDFRKVMAHVRTVLEAAGSDVSAARLRAAGVHVFEAAAVFDDGRTVLAGDVPIRARRFVLAAGSSPAVPPLPGLDEIPFLTPAAIANLVRRPHSLLVLGGGAQALELAQAFSRLGSQVTVVAPGSALPAHDRELAAVVTRALRGEGVAIHENSEWLRVETRSRGIRLHARGPAGETALDATHLLVAAGRTANVDGLGLDKARIGFGPEGARVSRSFRTSNRRVYALGSVLGRTDMGTTVAQAERVLRRLLLDRDASGTAPVARVVLTDPELAHIGLTEADAGERRGLRILRAPFSTNLRALQERRTEGFVKLLAGRDGRILGLSLAGAGAAELIQPWALAIGNGLTVADLASPAAPPGTLSEIGKNVAMAYFDDVSRGRTVRRLTRFLRLLR